MKSLGIDPVDDTRETFRALVDVMSRPGTVRTGSTEPMDRAVIAALVDHEVGIVTDDQGLSEALAAEGRLTEADVENAAVVHVDADGSDAADRIRAAPCGTLKEPSDGAIVVARVDALETLEDEADSDATELDESDEERDGFDADFAGADAQRLALTGPGVDGTTVLGVAGLADDAVAAIADAQSDFPRGIDVVLTSDDRVAALPRSVDLEVI